MNLYNQFRENPKICTDSRKVEEGSIFFALKGENFNGNKYAKDALENGARLAVVDEKAFAVSERTYLVDDTLKTLQDLAHFHRKQFNFPVLAITGSNGKTTTKELIKKVLGQQFQVFATQGNLNNHIGVPLSLLSIDPENTQLAIIELGANHLGENALLANISAPDYGLVTNIGKDHLEGFGGFQGCIRANIELYEYLEEQGAKAFINKDDELLVDHFPKQLDSISYGTDQYCFCQGTLLSAAPFLKIEWKTEGNPEPSPTFTNLVGEYNFSNLLAAACIGEYFGIPREKVSKGLSSYQPDNNRSQVKQSGSNLLILDAYNANPTSMEAALRSFSKMEGQEKFVILGDMLELGEDSEKEHKNILLLLDELNLKEGVLVGTCFQQAAEKSDIKAFPNIQEANKYLASLALEKKQILLKGSRGLQLEKALEVLE